MQKYEIMAIIVNDLDEKAAQKHIEEAIVGKIKELGGTITFEDFWGSRGFAYMIKHYTWGYYYVAQFEMDGQKTLELRRDLNIDSNVLRTLIISVDKKAPAPRKYADMQKEYAAQEKKIADEKEEAANKKAAGRREKLSTVKKAEAAPEKKDQPKEEKKDEVDQAIDKVLDDATADL